MDGELSRAHRLAVGDGILEALEERAEKALQAGRYAQAERSVRRLLEFDAGRCAARRLLGRVRLEQGRFHDAFEIFRGLCEQDAGDAWSACYAGEALFYAGEHRAARRWLTFAVDVAGAAAPRPHRRARILLQKTRRRLRVR
ncbi:MAG: tetratricopeptide repeat protein [Myxococcota bacterium]